MTIKQIQPSFAAGELAPTLYGRVDFAKYKVGLALARNWFVDYRGGMTFRPGTEFIDNPSGAVRVLPFIIGAQDSFLLVLGEDYIKIYQGGVYIGTTVTTPYLAADINDIKYTQSADVMTLVHPSYPPATLTYAGSGIVFTYAAINVGSKQAPPTNLVAHPPSTTFPDYCYSYVVTAVSIDGKNESVATAPVLPHYTILDETVGFVIPLSWTASASPTSVYRIYKCGPFDDRDSTGAGSVWGYIGSSQTTVFTDINIAPDFTQEPPIFGDPFSPGQIQTINVATGGSGYPSGGSWTGYIPLTITDSTGTGASGYAITDFSGVVRGVFLTSAGKNYTSPMVTAGAGGATFTTTLSSVGLADPTYPAAAGYFQQRSVFGGSTTKPETFVMSEIGNYFNFNSTALIQDTDAIVVEIASTQVNTILSFQPVSYGLMTFTTGGTFLINGGQPGSAITPSSITITPQASEGANNLPPLQINYAVLYMQNRGSIVRDLEFAWQRQSYTGSDISSLSSHLFLNFTFIDWAWAEAPDKIVWLTRNDGTMLSLTYVPDQEVYGWARHDTQGYFLSVASVPEGADNAVYFLVSRIVSGAWVTYVERKMDTADCCLFDSWYLDCAIASTPGFPAASLNISGTTGSVVITSPGAMSAEENYDSTNAADLLAGAPASGIICTDQASLAPSYNVSSRSMFYLAFIIPGVNYGTGNYTNDTTFTLTDGLGHAYAPAATINAANTKNFSPTVASKNIDTGDVTFYPTYDDTQTVPIGVGLFYAYISAQGSGYTHAALTITGGTGSGLAGKVTLDAGGSGKILNVQITDWGSGYLESDSITLSITGDGSGATVGHTMATPSDGTFRWTAVDFDFFPDAPNGPNLIDPNTGDFFVKAESCEVYHFRATDNFAQALGPCVYANNSSVSSNGLMAPQGVSNVWTYAFTQQANGTNHNELVLIPTVFTTEESAAGHKLAYVQWATSPFSSDLSGVRLTFGSSNAFVLSLPGTTGSGTGLYSFRLTKFIPPALGTFGANATGTMTDVTPWSAGVGPDADGLNYHLRIAHDGAYPLGSWAALLLRLPTLSQAVAILKFPKEANIGISTWPPDDFTLTQYGCCYLKLATNEYDYHSAFVTGYMTAAWTSTSDPALAAWAVFDVRETSSYLDTTNFLYDEDYSLRWLVFQCYPVVDGTPGDALQAVLVQYEFHYGAPPAVVQVVSERGLDIAYLSYGGAIGNTNVVAGSMLPGGSYDDSVGSEFCELPFLDPGIYDDTTKAFWFSGRVTPTDLGSGVDYNALFYLNPNLTYRAAYNAGGVVAVGGVTPPFLKITLGNPTASVGDIIEIGCAQIEITGVEGGMLSGTVSGTLPIAIPNDPDNATKTVVAGEWALYTPSSTFSGLDYLEGKQVLAFADGRVEGPFTVSSGEITLPAPAGHVVIGLQYQGQLQTLQLELEGMPTVQGQRKNIPRITVRTNCTLGLTVGSDFLAESQVPLNDFDFEIPYTAPGNLGPADYTVPIPPDWNTHGQVAIVQNFPLPANVLAIIPEVIPGDTAK